MPELVQMAVAFGVGCVAGAVNIMAGGGSALTLPTLMLLGLDAGTANGTNRVAILVQNLTANASFWRDGVLRAHESLKYALWTVPGAVTGAFVAVTITDLWFERLLGVVLIGVVITMAVPRLGRFTLPNIRRSRWIGPALLGIGFYGGLLQVGVGFLIMAACYHILRLDLVQTNVHKVMIVLVYTVPALGIFALSGHVNWAVGAVLAAGNASGAWIAARITVRKGEAAVRVVLMAALVMLAAKILNLL